MKGRRDATSLILGTAGHIDHGKTALVRALTGVDTDRLAEEKKRGITIELGFAELEAGEDLRFGVVDVPGHEGFVRTMLAGATGVDVVLLVVAADEGVMPQTREHLAIVRLLEVPALVVALTKVDLVDPEWLELVVEEVREALAGAPWAEAPVVPTSAVTGTGMDALREALAREAGRRRPRAEEDLARLPVDRVFTVRGTGTVVTGTLWSGRLRQGERVRLLPDGPEARIREVQVHGTPVEEARAGERTAVALVGPGIDRESLDRGQVLVGDSSWSSTSMLTVRAIVLEDTGWSLEHNQRVRVHLGTAEVMARAVPLEAPVVAPGERAWVQLRLERPLMARAGDHLVLRSYSPVTTIGGGRVAEPHPPKRSAPLPEEVGLHLSAILDGDALAAVRACLELAGREGAPPEDLPVRSGRSPAAVRAAWDGLARDGVVEAGGRALPPGVVEAALKAVLAAVRNHHADEPLRAGLPLELLRQRLPPGTPPSLADRLVERLEEEGRLRVVDGVAAEPGFRRRLTGEQERLRDELREVFRSAGLEAPSVGELPPRLQGPALWPILKMMEEEGELTALTEEVFAWRAAVEEASRAVVQDLGGRSGLGPADFRASVALTRKHLLPLLAYFDGKGITVRRRDGREVASTLP